jgi:hypothetical protein
LDTNCTPLMLNFSRNNDPGQSPLPENSRKWVEQSFEWLLKTFGEEAVRQRKVLTPHHTDFPIRYNGEIQTAHDTLSIVASAMEVDPAEIHLDFYSEGPSEISKGSVFGDNLYMKGDENAKTAAGLYWGREEDGKYHIWLERKNLLQPEGMVATLAHEIAHIKLLGRGNGAMD